jgi:trans-aconitate methyltransferase
MTASTIATLVSLVPFSPDESPRIVELCSGDGRLAEALLTHFPAATLVALEGDALSRQTSTARLAAFGDRARVAAFDITTLDWWDRMFGADLVVSAGGLNRLTDAKKQYLYKAAADRVSARGALLIADRVATQHPLASASAADTFPAALFHQLVWLKHAGFAAVDCFRMEEDQAVFGGFKQAAGSGPPLPAGS